MENQKYINYNIDTRLVDQFRATLTSGQVISEKNSNKKYVILDADLSSNFNFGSSVKVENFLIKIKKMRTKDELISYLPTNQVLDRFDGFTAEQLNILKEINVQVVSAKKLWNEAKEEERLNKKIQIQENIKENKLNYIRIENQKVENYNKAKFLVNELNLPKFQNKLNKLTKDDVNEVFDIIERLEPLYQEKKKREEEKENALKLEQIDLIDEDNRKVPINQWLNLYKKAQEYGDTRDLYESRAIIVNSVLYCNAARALIANNVGSIDKETGERTGKEGNKLYKACQTGYSYNGLYARLAEPDEIDSWVSNIYGDSWSTLINER